MHWIYHADEAELFLCDQAVYDRGGRYCMQSGCTSDHPEIQVSGRMEKISLAAVVVWGGVSGGAKLGFSTKVANIQPSELVKIVFVFFVASSFKLSLEFKNIVITTALAAFHVLILVASKDLGAALIIFVVYLVMLYVATRQPLYIFAGLGAGSLASVAATMCVCVSSYGKIRLLYTRMADSR